MMNRLSKLAVVNLLYLTTLPASADTVADQYSAGQTATNTSNIAQYLLNLGSYLGYNISQPPNKNNQVSSTLLNAPATQLIQTYMFNTFLGALPVNAFNTALTQFVPDGVAGASTLNAWANNTFNVQTYSNPSAHQQGKVSVSNGIDQQTFQQDPVNQSVLNILGTPDSTYCMNYDATSWVGCSNNNGSNGNLIPANSVMATILGPIPTTYQYFSYQYNQQFLSQLNSNTLISPLLYATQNQSANSTSSSPNSSQNQNIGLTAQNQAQQAENFIRYVTGGVTPVSLPKLKAYDTLYSQAFPSTPPSTPTVQQVQAQTTLEKYFTTLRTYAAQVSVGVGNLYFIMSKRLPQNQSTTGQAPSSQALSEFNMATWRLFNPDMSSNNQWINQLNNASPATVEKEIATLLAEINYQMYLDRQIQERLLLTNSIMLIQGTRASQPNSDFSSGQQDAGQ